MNAQRTDKRLPVDEEARILGRRLVRSARFGALGTLDSGTGTPMVSRVSVAADGEGRPLLLVSDLSAHTGAMRSDGRCSLLLGEPSGGDPLAHPRITVSGMAVLLEPQTDVARRARKRFLQRHPEASVYIDFADFHLVSIAVDRASLNGGFARAYLMGAADLVDPPVPADLVAAGERARLHMNEDHRDAIERLANRSGATSGDWTIATVDARGFEIVGGNELVRVEFLDMLTGPADPRKAFVDLVKTCSMDQGE